MLWYCWQSDSASACAFWSASTSASVSSSCTTSEDARRSVLHYIERDTLVGTPPRDAAPRRASLKPQPGLEVAT